MLEQIFSGDAAHRVHARHNIQKLKYAGKENPKGKNFEAIVRFVTPVFKDNKKVGYISEDINLVTWEDFDLWLKISSITLL